MKLPNTELKTAVAIEVCISEVFEGVFPSSGVVSTALAKMTADDTGGGIQDRTVNLKERAGSGVGHT